MHLRILPLVVVALVACSGSAASTTTTMPGGPTDETVPASTSTTIPVESVPTPGDPTIFIDGADSLIAALPDGSMLFTRLGSEPGCEGLPQAELWTRAGDGSEEPVTDASGAPLKPGDLELSPSGEQALAVNVCEEFLQSVILYEFEPPASLTNPVDLPLPEGAGGGRATFYPEGDVRIDVVRTDTEQFEATAYRYYIAAAELVEETTYFLSPYGVTPWTADYDVMVVPSPPDATRVMVGPQSSEALFTVLGDSYELSPDRTLLAVWSFPNPEQPEVPPLTVLDLATGDQQVVFDSGIHRLAWSPDSAELAFRAGDTVYFSDLEHETQMVAAESSEGCTEDWLTNAGAPLLLSATALYTGTVTCDYGTGGGEDFLLSYQIWERVIVR